MRYSGYSTGPVPLVSSAGGSGGLVVSTTVESDTRGASTGTEVHQ